MPHNRYGDLIEDDDLEVDRPHRCRRGWIDREADKPVPCLQCKPHLARPVDDRQEVGR